MDRAARTPSSEGRAERSRLSLPIRCPRCGTNGLVDWRSLEHGIKCPQCECEFMVNRGGRVMLLAELPHSRYSCPRCGHNGATPTMAAARRVDCAHCKLPLTRGPDQRFYDAKDAAELWRAEIAAGSARKRSESLQGLSEWMRTNDGRLHKMRLAMAAVPIVVAALFGFRLLTAYFDRSPETMARLFTESCLAGNANTARAFLDDDDDVQRIEFDRWRMRHFASITEKHRPKGDAVDVEVQVVKETLSSRVYYVSVASPFLGKRAHIQHWRLFDSAWLFDAVDTLASEDGTSGDVKPRAAGTP